MTPMSLYLNLHRHEQSYHQKRLVISHFCYPTNRNVVSFCNSANQNLKFICLVNFTRKIITACLTYPK
jgi:hypothetical protein